jgi:hypothetical protein
LAIVLAAPNNPVSRFTPPLLCILQVRSDRPTRELVCDEVNRSLARQEVLLAGLLERLVRAAALVTADSGKLAGIKQQLSKDLKDKVSAWVCRIQARSRHRGQQQQQSGMISAGCWVVLCILVDSCDVPCCA